MAAGVPIHHSLPGAANVLYINFLGGPLTNTAWNAQYNMGPVTAVPYSMDSQPSFSSDEQTAMSNIWSRVAEDYSPWLVDVTTEPPAQYGPTTGVVMVTHSTSLEGSQLPSSGSGGIAFLNVWGDPQYYP